MIDYAAQSRVTDPGEFADRLSEVPGDLAQMRAAARQLVFHYRAGGDYAENGIAPERIAEIDTRYASDMLARLFQLADQPLTRGRAPGLRIVGCCRDFTVLFLAIARQHGVAARARVGFATYFKPGWFLDHVVAEVWDAGQRRWRLVDPELPDGHIDGSDGALVDPMDLSASQFLTGPRAWRSCRSGTADPQRFVVDPGLDIPATRGWFQIRHNLIHDLASLAMNEMLLWDDWGLGLTEGAPTPDQLTLLDAMAAVTCSGDAPAEAIASFYQRDEFRVPPTVTSFSPARGAPLQVAI